MGTVLQDLRYALRQLQTHPGFALPAIVVLALGIGASAAMFSVVDQVILRRLPYADPSRLVLVGEVNGRGEMGDGGTPLPDVREWGERSHTLSALGYYTYQQPTLRGAGTPRLVSQMITSLNFFQMLGVKPALGRGFLPGEDQGARTQVLLLGDGAWRKEFGADAKIVGRVVTLNETPYTVIGVLPRGFSFQGGSEILFAPLDVTAAELQARDSGLLTVLGRLAPGATTEAATEELNGLRQQARARHPEKESSERPFVTLYEKWLTRTERPAVLALDGAVLLVWLVACANVAGLNLARTQGRRREIAVRNALGAGSGRLMRQFLTESLLLALVGGAVGLGIATGALHLLRHALDSLLLNGERIHVDAAVCGYLLLASCASAVIFGVGPAWGAARAPAQEGLREGAAAAGKSARSRSLGDALVVGEVAVSLVLLLAAGLMLRSLYALRHAELGFAPTNVITAELVFPQKSYWFVTSGVRKETNVVQAFYEPLLGRLRALPGVEAAGFSTVRPLNGKLSFSLTIKVAGQQKPSGGQWPTAACRAADAGYFRAMGIPLLGGRNFDASDTPESPMAAVVNRAFAQEIFAGRSALGQRFEVNDSGPRRYATIVGVVADTPQREATEAVQPEVLMNLDQALPTDNLYPILVSNRTDMVVRVARAPKSLMHAIEGAVHATNGQIAVDHVATMQEVVDDSLGSQQIAARLLSLFGGAALLIAVAGLYGLIAYQVGQRTREFGVRIALGAQRADVLRLVMRQALVLLGAGGGLGLLLAVLMGRWIGSFLYGVPADDLWTFAAVALVLGTCGLVASYLPARRAAAVNPVDALRSE